jgi:SpoVK/Ycf46/Vps4 family AAA+-type ATPase
VIDAIAATVERVPGVNPMSIAERTDGLSGADLAYVCDTATQLALADSVRTAQARSVTMADIEAAIAQIRPSAGRDWTPPETSSNSRTPTVPTTS